MVLKSIYFDMPSTFQWKHRDVIDKSINTVEIPVKKYQRKSQNVALIRLVQVLPIPIFNDKGANKFCDNFMYTISFNNLVYLLLKIGFFIN